MQLEKRDCDRPLYIPSPLDYTLRENWRPLRYSWRQPLVVSWIDGTRKTAVIIRDQLFRNFLGLLRNRYISPFPFAMLSCALMPLPFKPYIPMWQDNRYSKLIPPLYPFHRI